uniref:NADH-ubiquinone oxidoreductase chain 4 n=1 Tax=Ismarus sp. ZJUH_2016020 TaxID=2491162 RepID=A0A3S8V0Z1_9HYME|nr:NADH dehydrogenase subunit 4 [Ismarus sp. ZJUH_2016020]
MMILIYLLFLFLIMLFNFKLKIKFLANMMFLLSFYLILKFSLSKYYWFGLSMFLGYDKYSYLLLILLFWIIGLMVLSSNKINIYLNIYYNLILFLTIFLYLCFSSMNYFMFYIYFEMSLIPIFMMVMGWGYQPERIKSSFYMLLYTLFFSLPLLLIMFFLLKFLGSMNLLILNNLMVNIFFNLFMYQLFYFLMILAFLVKLPIYLIHVWLPKAHVEASVSGSMVLAAIMLKLGGYGLIRSLLIMLNFSFKFNMILMMMVLWGSLILSMICMIQIDMKMLVAYSSIVHMMFMLMGLLSMSLYGFMGGLLMMLSHGLCSSGMFCLVNFSYERLKSRIFFFNKGMNLIIPSMMLWWFLLCSSNLSSPPSLNLLSEMLIFISLMMWCKKIFILLILMLFLSVIYSIYLYSKVQHGKLKYINMMYENNIREYLIILLHWFPLNFLILNVKFMI